MRCPAVRVLESEQFWYEVNTADPILGQVPAGRAQAPREKGKLRKNMVLNTRSRQAVACAAISR
ncbi:MAG: hypothetical protein HY647_10615 [Acidobacteria bacterium]|nr:hypothetical protein [Acidobacteriota bacterium]